MGRLERENAKDLRGQLDVAIERFRQQVRLSKELAERLKESEVKRQDMIDNAIALQEALTLAHDRILSLHNELATERACPIWKLTWRRLREWFAAIHTAATIDPGSL